MSFLIPYYLWIKAFHLISVIAWMAGQFYLPRLFVYHCQTKPFSVESERFKIMERRLMRAIINPAMMFSFLFGILLVLTPGVINWHTRWWHVKILCLVLMTAYHGACSLWRKGFAADKNKHSERFYRIANEVPTILMIIIVIMVIVKPF